MHALNIDQQIYTTYIISLPPTYVSLCGCHSTWPNSATNMQQRQQRQGRFSRSPATPSAAPYHRFGPFCRPNSPGSNRPLAPSAPLDVQARSWQRMSSKNTCMACACVPLPAERPPGAYLKHASRRLGRSLLPSPRIGHPPIPRLPCEKGFAWSSAPALFFRAARRCTGSRVPASWGVSDLRSSTKGGNYRRLAIRELRSLPSCPYLGQAGSRVRGHGLRARALRRT